MTNIAATNGFRYSIRSAPALNLPIGGLTMVGDARDMERGVLLIDEHSHYLPVQAILQEMAEPDLIVDVADGEEILTTLHFCTIWHSIQQGQNAETWDAFHSQPSLWHSSITTSAYRSAKHVSAYTRVPA